MNFSGTGRFMVFVHETNIIVRKIHNYRSCIMETSKIWLELIIVVGMVLSNEGNYLFLILSRRYAF